jgi:hypothetical protein
MQSALAVPITGGAAAFAILLAVYFSVLTLVSGWTGDPPGGHHRKGVLQFAPPAEPPAAVELQLSGIGGVATRSFRWQLK